MFTKLEESKTSRNNPQIIHASENFTFENVKLKHKVSNVKCLIKTFLMEKKILVRFCVWLTSRKELINP